MCPDDDDPTGEKKAASIFMSMYMSGSTEEIGLVGNFKNITEPPKHFVSMCKIFMNGPTNRLTRR